MEILIHRGTGTIDGETTPVALVPGTSAATTTNFGKSTVNDTTQLTDGVIVHSDAFSVLDGWVFLPPPEDRIVLGGGDQLAVSSDIAVTSGTWNGTMIVEAIG